MSGDEWEGGKTHLNGAAVPGEDGGLAFSAKEIGFALCEFCAEYFGVTVEELLNGEWGGTRRRRMKGYLYREGCGGVELEAILGFWEETPFFGHGLR